MIFLSESLGLTYILLGFVTLRPTYGSWVKNGNSYIIRLATFFSDKFFSGNIGQGLSSGQRLVSAINHHKESLLRFPMQQNKPVLHIFSILICFLCITLNGCVQSNSQTSEDSAVPPPSDGRPLRVGISATAPPMDYKESGQITGLEVEFAHGLAAVTGRKLEIIEVKWKDQIPYLLAGKTDIIMSAMSITNERREVIAFSDPYMVSGLVSLVREEDKNNFYNGSSDLLPPEVKVGTVKGTTGNVFVERMLEGAKKQYTFSASQLAVNALIAKEIDVFVYDLPMNFYYGAENKDKGLAPIIVPMTREEIGWGIRQDDKMLLYAANGYIGSLKRTGQLRSMLTRWIPYFRHVFNR